MKKITHLEQKEAWEKEHTNPSVLLQMDSEEASSGVVEFFKWLQEKCEVSELKGIEMGCGKGRNSIWLGEKDIEMVGFDFSEAAIKEASRRKDVKGLGEKVKFLTQDATISWPFKDNTFDIAIDCFASTDIEGEENRTFAISEFKRVLRPGGYLFAYLLSTEDEFHKKMIGESPAEDSNSFLHPATGKFEKVFDDKEIAEAYKDFKLVEKLRIKKMATFFSKQYSCNHHWLIFQK